MTTRLPHLRAAVYATPWALMPGHLEALMEVIERRAMGIRFTPEEIAAVKGPRGPTNFCQLIPMALNSVDARAGASAGQQATPGSIAVIPLFGLVSQHAGTVDDVSGPGGTSTERLVGAIRAAKEDPSVKSILINIDSPGGSVYNVQEAADAIYQMRGDKPIVGQVNSLCASAAYWLASSCDEIVMAPSGEAGSIGVFGTHIDASVAHEKQGVKATLVHAGEFKVEGNPYSPLSESGLASMQATVNRYYNTFVSDVARGRGVSFDAVANGFGRGRVLGAKDALKAGMVDKIGTLDQTLQRLGAARKSAKLRAFLEQPGVEATEEADSKYFSAKLDGGWLTAGDTSKKVTDTTVHEEETREDASKSRQNLEDQQESPENAPVDAPKDAAPTAEPAEKPENTTEAAKMSENQAETDEAKARRDRADWRKRRQALRMRTI